MVVKEKLLRILKKFKHKEQPLINILTRTSGRPVGFKKCRESIDNQTYKKVRHIVSYDELADLAYLDQYNEIDKIKVQRLDKPLKDESPPVPSEFKPYNLYCNDLLNMVSEGWVMFLDDDDMLANEKVLENIVTNLQNGNNKILIWQTKFPNGALLPPEREFQQKKIFFERIDTACFMFHSKYKEVSKWDGWYAADYRFLEGLTRHIPKQKWISQVFTLKNNLGDKGRRNDIPG